MTASDSKILEKCVRSLIVAHQQGELPLIREIRIDKLTCEGVESIFGMLASSNFIKIKLIEDVSATDPSSKAACAIQFEPSAPLGSVVPPGVAGSSSAHKDIHLSFKLNIQKLVDEGSNIDNIIDVLMSPKLKNFLSEDLKNFCKEFKKLILTIKEYTKKSEGLFRREDVRNQIRSRAMDAIRY